MSASLPNVRSLLSSPRRYEPDLDKNGVLQFRHPWVVELLPPDAREGPGIVVRRSYARLNELQRAAVLMTAKNLLSNAPRHRKNAPPEAGPKLLDAYFQPMEELDEVNNDSILAIRVSPPGAPLRVNVEGVVVEGEILNDPHALFKLGQQVSSLTRSNSEHIQAATVLRRENEELKRIVAQKERQLNKHVSATLADALAEFKTHYRPGDPQTKRNAEATLEKFIHGGQMKGGRKVRGLGPRKLLAEIVAHDIDKWLDDYPNSSKASTIHRRAHLSIFFTTCQRVFDMAFTPFTSGRLKPRGDLLTIYKKRAPVAIKRVEDLRLLLDALDQDIYWQSWVAFACLAGPRWSEQRSLFADALDLKAVPPRAVIQATAEAGVKTVGNAVPIEEILLLPIMKKFVATWEPGRRLAWPSLRKNRKRGGEPAPEGAWRYNTFSRELKRVLAKARASSRDPNHAHWNYGPAEWRHTFGTLLALSGKNVSEIAAWMRNSSEVASACYVNFNPTDERVRGRLKWE